MNRGGFTCFRPCRPYRRRCGRRKTIPPPSGVSRDGRRVFVSNRGADVITVFEAEGEALRLTRPSLAEGLGPGTSC